MTEIDRKFEVQTVVLQGSIYGTYVHLNPFPQNQWVWLPQKVGAFNLIFSILQLISHIFQVRIKRLKYIYWYYSWYYSLERAVLCL